MNRDEIEKLLGGGTETDHWSYDDESGTIYTENSNAICDLISSDEDGHLLAAAPALARTALALMAQLEDANAAQALVVERAADFDAIHAALHHAEAIHREDRTLGDFAREVVARIRALADPSGVEDLAALRAEIADLKLNMDADLQTMIREGAALKAAIAEAADLRARLAAAEAQVAALREADIDAAMDAMEAYMRREGVKTVAWRTDMPPDDQAKLRACVDAGVRAALASAQGGAK